MPRRSLPTLPVAAIAVAAVLALGACGDDDTSTTATGTSGGAATTPPVTATAPVATAPEATEPPPDATAPGDATVPPPPSTAEAQPAPSNTAPAEQGGAAEEPVRVPATFAISGGRLDPPTITVPPFLAVEVSVSAPAGSSHEVVVQTPQPQRFTVQGGGRAAVRLPGLRAGSYAIEVDGADAGTLVAGGEVGP